MENQQVNIKQIYLFGEIDGNVSRECIETLLDIDFVKENIKILKLYISSEGGFLFDCFAIIDCVLDLKTKYNLKIETYGLGQISSAGLFLFLLGDTRILYKNCKVYVHEHITTEENGKTYGERLKEDKTQEKDIYEMYFQYSMNQLNLNKQQVKKFLALNKWMTKKEIEKFNIVKNNV